MHLQYNQFTALNNKHFHPADLQKDVGVCAITLHRVDDQVPLEVACVEPREGQAIAVASQRGRDTVRAGWLRGCGVHVLEQEVQTGARDATTHV